MKRYFFLQWTKRIAAAASILLFMFGVSYSIWYLFSKPPQSKIILTDISQIAYDDLSCNDFVASDSFFAEQFPLSITYQPDHARLYLSNGTKSYLAQLRISNAEHVFVTTKKIIDGEETSKETELLAANQIVSLEINASRFDWQSSIVSSDFDEVKNIISPGAYPDYSNVTCDFYDCFGEPIEEFEWIPNKPSISYKIGLCGVNLKYLSIYDSATLDSLNSLGVDIISTEKDKTAWILKFTQSTDDNYFSQTRDETIVRIILNPAPNLEDSDLTLGNGVPSISLLFTQFADQPRQYYEGRIFSEPGLILDAEKTDQRNIKSNSEFYFPIAEKVSVRASRVTIDSPIGAIIGNSPKINIPEEAEQLIVYSKSEPFAFFSQEYSFVKKKYEITGRRIGASVDGKEYLPSPWESIPREIQVAYITVFVPLLAAVIGYGIQKRKDIDAFIDWLFLIPRYRRPVKLHDGAHIFQLINGKKISGIIDTFEGKSTFRVFVLTEVREWDKDNWSEVLPTEVRVPQNQIEMYYKAHP